MRAGLQRRTRPPRPHGGRWKVVNAYGITTQLTNADAVTSTATTLIDTEIRTECPPTAK